MRTGQIVKLADIFPGSTDLTETVWNGRIVRVGAPVGLHQWIVYSWKDDSGLVVFDYEMLPVFNQEISQEDTTES
jgi:hypothetical protein